ncbi:MAG: MerR family transcriptional regulator [Dysgonamonadaceae bacterium]|jgi:DNA-binding transcriptional MerR regulator|nr:MerR family transcriptional regulator [Dysgonamonadaceae bacterium]
MDKLFHSISEVARMLNVTSPTLRYWEKEFGLNPHKTEKGSRRYSKKDVEALRLIHHLVKTKGLTLAGAKQKLKENPDTVTHSEEIVRRLKIVRAELAALVKEFDEMEKLISRKIISKPD